MVDKNFSDAALVLIGHGSTLNQLSSQPVRQLAEQLAARKLFAQVSAAFHLEEPQIANVPDINAPRIFIVPITISEGHFTEQIVRRSLGLVGDSHARQVYGRQLIYCRPVGTHLDMTEILLTRARDIVNQHPFPRAPRPEETALFIAGHGTEKNENSRDAIEAQVEAIRARSEYADVQPAFMEEAPFIADCYNSTEARHIVVIPFFIADGLHTAEDIPVLLGEPKDRVQQRLAASQPIWRNPTERKGRLVWYSKAIGSDPGLAEIILARAREGAEKFLLSRLN